MENPRIEWSVQCELWETNVLCFAPCKIQHNTELPTGCFERRIMRVHDGEIEHLLRIEVGTGDNVSNVSCMYVCIA